MMCLSIWLFDIWPIGFLHWVFLSLVDQKVWPNTEKIDFFSNWAFFSHEKCKWNVYDNQISRRRLINFWWPKDQVQFLSLYKEDKSRQFKDIASTSMTMLDHQTIANLDVFSKIILLEYNWWLHQSWFLYINRLDLST